jgi:L-lactate dehydrogenase
MKLGIIGVGAVGAATAMAVVLRARVRELVLIDKDRARARAVATDMHYGVPLSPLVKIKDGDYDDLEGAGLVIIAAGINEKAGGATDRSDPAGRLRLLDANVRVFETIAPRLVKVAPDAVILIVTDPPEPLIDVTRHLVGHDRVIGTSTYLDSLRFRVHLAERFAVSPACVEANVVGEHGTSSVFLWSSARIGGMGVADALAKRGSGFDAFRREVEQDARYALRRRAVAAERGSAGSSFRLKRTTSLADESFAGRTRIRYCQLMSPRTQPRTAISATSPWAFARLNFGHSEQAG